MKKTIIALALLVAATAAEAQLNSRFMFATGGGFTFMGKNHKKIEHEIGGMGKVDFNYIFTYSTSVLGVGFKTGIDLNFAQPRLKARTLTDIYTETDYQGNELEYTVTANTTKYKLNMFNLDIPIMLAIQTNKAYFNIGAKFFFPLWNNYTQTISEADISAYSPSQDKLYINEPMTGVVSEAQKNMKGKETISPLYIGFSMEFGMVWELKNHHSLGFEIFVDPVAVGVGGKQNETQCLIEADPATKAGEQANVRVNNLTSCYDFRPDYGQMGLKLVYCFDMSHKIKKTAEREPVILMTPEN